MPDFARVVHMCYTRVAFGAFEAFVFGAFGAYLVDQLFFTFGEVFELDSATQELGLLTGS